MALYQKVNGVWTQASRPYVKRANVWTPVQEAYVKRSGVWTRAYEYDVQPPPPPLISLQLIDTSTKKNLYRHILVGVRVGPTTNTWTGDIQMIRVLTTYQDKAPTTQFGGTYTSAAAAEAPTEPWSDFYYDGRTVLHDPSQNTYKRWPRNASNSNTLVGGRTYHFSAWTLDDAGNWSAGTHANIFVHKNSTATGVVRREAHFQPTWGGTYSGANYVEGKLVQQGSPGIRRGVYGYNNQLEHNIGQLGTPTIVKAQIYLVRENDSGAANANIYMARHNWANAADLQAQSGAGASTVAKLGQLAKGQGKWFDVPAAHLPYLKSGIRGFTFWDRDPTKAAAGSDDYSELRATTTSTRHGELAIVWEESV